MDLRRVRWSDWLTGLGGVTLLGFLFIPWFTAETGWTSYAPLDGGAATSDEPPGGWETVNAFEAFSVTDVVLLLFALGAIALPIVTAAKSRTSLPVGLAVLLSATVWLGPLLVVIALLFPPDEGAIRAGAWLGLISSLVVLAGAWLSLRDERAPHIVSTPPERLEIPAGT